MRPRWSWCSHWSCLGAPLAFGLWFHPSFVHSQELDLAPSTGKGSPDGAAVIAGVDSTFRNRTTVTAAFTQQGGSAITGGLVQVENKLVGEFKMLGAAGYAVSNRAPVTHAVDLRAGATYLYTVTERFKLKNQTMVEALVQNAPTGDLFRFRSRFEAGWQLVGQSSQKPIVFTSVEPIGDQQHTGLQQVRVQAGFMAVFERLAYQVYYRREQIMGGPENSRDAVFFRAILRVAAKPATN